MIYLAEGIPFLSQAALIADIELCSRRLERAEALVSGLRDEQIRWTDSRVQIQTNEINLLGDAVLCAAFCSYLGGFNGSYRESLLSEWTRSLRSHRVHVREGWSPTADMGDASITRGWHLNGLPTDATSVENALLTMADVQLVGRWPLIVDPQRQAHRWLHATYSSAAGATGPSLMTIGASADGLVAALTLAMQRGVPLLVEDVGEILDPALQQCLLPSAAAASSKARGQIQIGEREIECDPKFRLYLTTVLANPKYVAGTAVRLNIINFTVTRSGLSEHLLHDVVRLEQPDLGKKHDALLVNIAADQQQLIDIEERILGMLNRAAPGVGILDDEDLIETLSSSKVTSMIVRERLAESGVTEAEMRKSREAYQSVAARASLLYFVLVDMARVDPMYQYSLEYFRDIFSRSIAGAADAMGEEDLSARLTVLVNAVTVGVHVAISRGLFKKHQLLFSFLISTAIQRASGSITEKEWVLLLRGTSTPGRRRSSSRLLRYRVDDATTLISNPAPSELTADTWRALTEAEAAVPGMRGLSESVASDWSRWKDWISDPAAHRAPLPFDWENRLSAFQKLLTARILAPACAGGAAREMVEQHLGKRFTGPSAAINMQSILSEMSSSTPCLFILSDESDAETALLRYAASECSSMPKVVSLGRGQGIKAEQAICTGSEQGSWVLLQNCHLAKSWLPRLEQMVSDLTDTAALAPASHPDFRLFLTAFPAPYFPVGVLQRCIKITDEPPRSVKENLRRSFSLLAEKRSLSAPLGKRLLLGLCFFHAVSQERSKYGPIGWNCAYHFSGSDLEMAAQLLGRTVQEMQLSEDTALGLLDNLVFITGNITYGGRVTDDWDRRCLLTILDHFYRSSLFGEAEQPTGGERPRYRRRLSSSSAMIAAAPHMEMPLDYEGYISQIPSEDGPDVFGMHASADMSLRLRESTSLFHDVLRLQPRKAGGTTGGGMSASATVMNTANDMLARLPGKLQFRKEGAQNYLTRRGSNTEVAGANEDPLIVVLIQELDGYNALLDRVKRTLTEVQRSIRGEIVMSTALEDVMECILLNAVPRAWKGTAGFASIKPLSSWTSDLAQRMSFFGTWLERGQPRVFHLPAFRFPHGFLTAVLQNHSRQHGIPINLLRFRHEYPSEQDISATDTLAVKEGVYVAGLSIEGGSWDAEAKVLRDPRGLEIRSPAPVIHFLPAKDYKPDADKNYICPLYQVNGNEEMGSCGSSTSQFC
jgi:dynein heavy chain